MRRGRMTTEGERPIQVPPEDQRVPAEMRVTPTVEPTVEIDEGTHLPPEAAATLVTRHEATDPRTPTAEAPAASTGDSGRAGVSYQAVAAAEAAAEEASLPPAEM